MLPYGAKCERVEQKMTEVLTAAQMRAIETEAMACGAVTGLELMERAGAGVVAAGLGAWAQSAAGGGAGGVVCGLADPVTRDARAMGAAWTGPGVGPADLDWPDFRASALVVDAMFGIGLARDIGAGVWGLLEMAQASACKLVAVGILSGLCAGSGRGGGPGGYLEWA